MKRILILFAHPALQKSHVNVEMIRGLKRMEGVTFHDLYQAYPEFDIDVSEEQQLLKAHDIIIMQHPLFWYSTPAILKEWQDLVLEHGWAYGKEGNALKGKILFNAITTGGRKQAYCEEGYNRYTIRQFLAPLERTAVLCKMTYLPPFVIHGTHSISHKKIEEHHHNYKSLIKQLRDDAVDYSQTKSMAYLNEYLE